MKKIICDICKKLLSKDPKFIDVDKIENGMRLQEWFQTDYEPTCGRYAKVDSELIIRHVYGDMIFYSRDNSVHVSIMTRNGFDTCTLIKNINQ